MPKTLPNGLVVYTCDDWGARAPLHEFLPTTPTAMVLHHMATQNRAPVADHAAAVQTAFALFRQIQAMHMDANTWADSGQHFSVSIDGIVGEGRHGSLAALLHGHCIRGAHAADGNIDFNDSWGVEHEGTFTDVLPNAIQWEASVKLHAFIALACKLDTVTIIGHRDTGIPDECNGEKFHAAIPLFRQETHSAKLALMQAHR